MENTTAGMDRSETALRWIAMALAFACFLAAGACGPDRDVGNEEEVAAWVVADQGSSWQEDVGADNPAVTGTSPDATPAETPPRSRTVSYGDGEEAFRAGRYGEAIDLFSVYADQHPGNAWARYMLGISAWKGGHLDVAETHLLESVELVPDHVKGLVNLARVLIEAGRPEEAQLHAAAAEQIDPASTAAKRVLARALAESGDRSGALAKYEDALWIDPLDTWSLNNMGYLLVEQGRYDGAVGPLALAVQLDTANATFQNNLGSALEGAGFPTAALIAFRSAAALDPDGKAAASVARLEVVVKPAAVAKVTATELAQAYREQLLMGSAARSDTAGRIFPRGGS